ncbi:MAG: cation transporter [Clostridia bacterium]|nr:cation transporter [Clostridia bacterium]
MTQWLINRFVKDAANTSSQPVRTAYGTLGSLVGILINVLLAALKFFVGVLTGSVAVTADAVNNLSDAGGSIMSLVSVRMAQKPVDAEHPFGHGRIEYLGALGVGVLILMMGVELLKEGVGSIITPEPVAFTWLTFILLAVSVIFKFWLAGFYKRVGGAINSETLKAAAKDSLSDVIATSAVILSMVLGHCLAWPVDGYMGVLVALVVLKAGFEVCKDTVDRLLGGKPDPEMGRALVNKVLTYPGILGVHDLVIHDYGPGRCVASLHAEVSSKANIVAIHEIIDQMEREILQEMALPVCIHMDPIVTDDVATNEISARMAAFLLTVDERLKLHDFRRVPGENQINLIFDVLLPADYKDAKGLEGKIKAYAKGLDPRHECILHFDVDMGIWG